MYVFYLSFPVNTTFTFTNLNFEFTIIVLTFVKISLEK